MILLKQHILIINLKVFLIQSIARLRYQRGNKYSTSFSFQWKCISSQHAEAKLSCLYLKKKNTNFILKNNIEIIIQGVFFIPGQEMAQEYNFPEEIIAHGFFDNWNVIECIKNMNKLVLISNETPVKKRRNWYFSFYHHTTLNAKLKQKLRNETHERTNEINTEFL